MGSLGSKKTKRTDSPLDQFAKSLKTRPDEDCKKELCELIANHSEESKNDTKKNVQSKSVETIVDYTYKSENFGSDRVEGEDEEELWGNNLLHLAVSFQKNKTAALLLKEFPKLISKWKVRESNYLGLTPFHIAIAQGNVELVKNMLEYTLEHHIGLFRGRYEEGIDGSKTDVKNALAYGRARGTVFMGELPLTVAVLSYINNTQHDEDDASSTDAYLLITQSFLDEESLKLNLGECSQRGDTVFHSIMRFVHCFPQKQVKAKLVLKFLDDWMCSRLTLVKRRSVYFAQNIENQTALQLAAKFSHIELVRYLVHLKGVYSMVQPHDRIYEICRYDMTEIDKVALHESERHTGDVCDSKLCGSFRKKSCGQSIAELLCSRRSLDVATSMVNMDVFEAVIRTKWTCYRWYFTSFFLFHLFNVVCLNVHIVANGHEIVDGHLGPVNLVVGFNSWFLVVGLVYVLQEIWRIVMAGQPMAYRAVHHNVIYRFCLLITGGCLILHSCTNFAPDFSNNWFLPFAVIASNWFLLFFLRGCPYFCTYIVLINEALFKTVLPFAVLILLQVFAFSSCMHSFFLDLEPEALSNDTSNNTPEVSFQTYGKTLLALGKLMVGITDIEDLLGTNQDVAVLILFVTFIIVTFLLMINALIGVMTNKFSDTQTNRVQVGYIQMLSIIIFFEGWFVGPSRALAKRAGEEFLYRDDLNSVITNSDVDKSKPKSPDSEIDNHRTNEYPNTRKRFIISYRKVPSNQSEEPSNIEHKLNRSHNILEEKIDRVEEKIDRVLESVSQKSSDQQCLHVYHYGKD